MACTHYKDNKCKNGFPVTTGCWATGELEKNTINQVKCADEEWCGKTYFSGKPFNTYKKGDENAISCIQKNDKFCE